MKSILLSASACIVFGFTTALAADRDLQIGQPVKFRLDVSAGPARTIYIAYGKRDYGTSDWRDWPHVRVLCDCPESDETVSLVADLPPDWGTENTKFRVFSSDGKKYDYEVEYIQSTTSGGCCREYIDTGIDPDDQTTVAMMFTVEEHGGTKGAGSSFNYSRLYGARKGNSRYDGGAAYAKTATETTNALWGWPYDATQSTGVLFVPYGEDSIWYPNTYTIVHGLQGVTVSNHTTAVTKIYNDFNNGAGSPPKNDGQTKVGVNLYLFGLNNAASPGATEGCVGRMYYCNIATGATQVAARQFVPVSVGGRGALYDNVTGAVFSNKSGSGGFVAGPKIEGTEGPARGAPVYAWSQLASARRDGFTLLLK